MLPDPMYTWESLGTFAGATAAVLLIVQYLKLPLDNLHKFPTRAVALVLSALIQLFARLAAGAPWRWSDLPLILVNAFLVALSAMGAYEATFAPGDRAKSAAEG